MKKFIFVFLSIILFSACSFYDSDSILVKDQSLYMVTSPSGLLFNYYAYSQDGCYEIHTKPGASANILYTDFSTKQKIYLSSDISGRHDNEADTSYITNAYGTFYPLVTKKGLVIISNTSDLLIKKYGDKALGRISISSLSGEGRRTLYTLAANEWISDTSGIARDSEKIYFIDYYLETENLGQKCQLVSVDLDSGEKQVLEDLSSQERVFIIGAFDNRLVMKKITVSDPDKPWYEQFESQEHEIYTYDIYSREKNQVFSYSQSSGAAVCQDSRLIYLDYGQQSLNITDIKNGLQTNYQLKNKISTVKEYSGIRNEIFDGHVMLHGVSSDCQDNQKFVALDLSNGIMKEINLYSDGKFCGIYAETDDSFLVANGEFEYEVEYYIQGVPDKIKSKTIQFALIKKSDYWNSVPNFENINYDIYKSLNYS